MKRPVSLLCEPRAEERKESRIRELDLLVLPRDLLEQGLKADDMSTVMLVHKGGASSEVESTLGCETLAVVSVPMGAVRPSWISERLPMCTRWPDGSRSAKR